jgi:tRNA dimethylallyltransferase
MDLAERFGGEIVGADSVQVYRGFDIGSAKATPEDRQRIPHHMLDVADARQEYSAAEYARGAAAAIQNIVSRGRLPIVVGGTGLYFQALFEGLIAAPGKDEAVRERLGKLPTDELRRRLAAADPERERRILGEDRFRLIRALEIFEVTGRRPSDWERTQPAQSDYDVLWLGLNTARTALYQRIDTRVDTMWHAGWPAEVRGLIEAGYGETRAMGSVGYAEVAAYLAHRFTAEEALEKARRRTRNYAKRQLTWFRGNPAVQWLDLLEPDSSDRMTSLLEKWLR